MSTLLTNRISHIDPYTTNGITLAEHINNMSEKINSLKDELVEMWLLSDLVDNRIKSVYEMSYEEYIELPGKVRL